MARLLCGQFRPKCAARGCQNGATHICEWDQQRAAKTVSRNALYCGQHAGRFAERHRIFPANLPGIDLADLDTASRDRWAIAH